MSKRFLISAWIGRGNFGDELLSFGLRLELNKLYGEAQITYFEKGPFDIYKYHLESKSASLDWSKRFSLVNRYRKKLKNYSKFDGVFFGGGSIFHSYNSIEWKYDLLRRFIKTNKTGLKAAFGVSLGPFESIAAEALALEFISKLDFIHCRDEQSANIARKKLCDSKVISGNDLAFTVRDFYSNWFVSKNKVNKLVGISFLLENKFKQNEKNESFNKMINIVNYLTSNGYSVALIGLYTGNKYRDDILNKDIFAKAAHQDKITMHSYSTDIEETVRFIANCSFYISMRLHGIITAYLSGVPFMSINNNNKVVGFVEGISLYESKNDKIFYDLSYPIDTLLDVIGCKLENINTEK